MKNCPCASETTLTPSCSTIICAPTKAPPDGSVTRPRIAPLLPCADAFSESSKQVVIATRFLSDLKKYITPLHGSSGQHTLLALEHSSKRGCRARTLIGDGL